MEDESHSVSNQQSVADPQANIKILSQFDEDTDVANENLDVGGNFEYNSKDTKMFPIYQDQEDQVNLQDFNDVESSRPNKHIRFEFSPSFEEKEEIVPETPSSQQGNDDDTDYISTTPPHDQCNVSPSRTPSPDYIQTSLFCFPEAPQVQHDFTSHAQLERGPPIQQVLHKKNTIRGAIANTLVSC